jgi:hypothetical protein
MRQVLAELHALINELEDQGLVAEASTLQDVFVRVAAEDIEEDDDLANDVAGLLKSHSAAEVLAEIAKQMGGEDSDTASFAFGDEPGADGPSRNEIVGKYSAMYMRSNGAMNPNELAARASEETGTDVSASEITRGPGYNSQAQMAAELGRDFSKMPYGRMSPTE